MQNNSQPAARRHLRVAASFNSLIQRTRGPWSICYSSGAPGRLRTCDLRSKSPLLCHLSYKRETGDPGGIRTPNLGGRSPLLSIR